MTLRRDRGSRSSPRAPSSCAETATTATGRFSRTPCSRSGSIPRASRSSAMLPRISRPRCAKGSQADLCVVSGGLGPTHDDRTVEMVARAAGTDLVVDEDLEAADRGRLPVVRRTPRQAVRRLRARRPQAGDAPRGRGLDRPGRHGAGLRAAERRRGRGRPARPTRRAPAAVAGRARDGAVRTSWRAPATASGARFASTA